MGLDVGKVVGTLELQDKWNTTLEKAAASTNTFATTATAALTRASASTDQLARTTLTMSGRLAVAQASARSISGEINTLAAAIVTSGGATAEESRRLNDLTNQLRRVEGASAGFRAALDGIATRGTDVANVGKALHQSFGQFDSVLASVGVNLGTPVKGLGELASAATSTTTELGLLGVAGIAVGTGIAAWKIGRAAAEFFDLDRTIGDATAKLLGWGDVAAETAAAQADVLAKATRDWGVSVTDVGAAMLLNAETARRHADAIGTSQERLDAWHATIDKIATDGKFLELVDDLKAGVIPLEQLAKKYATNNGELVATVDQIAAVRDAIRGYIADTKKLDDAITEDTRIHQENWRKLQDAQDQLDQRRRAREQQTQSALDDLADAGDGFRKVLDDVDGSVVEAVKHYLQLNVSHQSLQTAYELSARQVNAIERAMKAEETQTNATAAATFELARATENRAEIEARAQDKLKAKLEEEARAREANVKAIQKEREEMDKRRMAGGSFDVTSANLAQTVEQMTAGGRGAGNGMAAEALAKQGYSLAEIMDIFAHPGRTLPPPRGPRIPGFKRGVRNFRGGPAVVGEDGAEVVDLPPGSDVLDAADSRALWDRLNEQQAALWRAGKDQTAEYLALVERMQALTPAGFGEIPTGSGAVPASRRGAGAVVIHNHIDARGALFPDRQSLRQLGELLDRSIVSLGRDRGERF